MAFHKFLAVGGALSETQHDTTGLASKNLALRLHVGHTLKICLYRPFMVS